MKDKPGMIVGIIVAAVVLGTLSLYLLSVGNIGQDGLLSVVIVLILVAFVLFVLWDKIKCVKKGLPAEDERTKLVNYKAGYYGFIAALWGSFLGPMFFEIAFDHELEGGGVTTVVVLVSGFTFVVSYVILAARGDMK
ncbi:MAG: hypothetical protein KAT70_05925 [Thermoplasmata archaeon]|nr:hypothetical protein [Thermoplasmata archaeon]